MKIGCRGVYTVAVSAARLEYTSALHRQLQIKEALTYTVYIVVNCNHTNDIHVGSEVLQ